MRVFYFRRKTFFTTHCATFLILWGKSTKMIHFELFFTENCFFCYSDCSKEKSRDLFLNIEIWTELWCWNFSETYWFFLRTHQCQTVWSPYEKTHKILSFIIDFGEYLSSGFRLQDTGTRNHINVVIFERFFISICEISDFDNSFMKNRGTCIQFWMKWRFS